MAREEIRLRPGENNVDMGGNALVVDLEWEFPSDLDLAALCVTRDGNVPVLVCHGQEGRRCGQPFTHLAHSSEGDGRRKARKEHLVITDADQHEVIYLFVWDHNAVEDGFPADFARVPDSYQLSITDRHNKRIKLETNPHDSANCLLVGRIKSRSVRAIESARQADKGVELMSVLSGMLSDERGALA